MSFLFDMFKPVNYENINIDDYYSQYVSGQSAHTLVDVRTPQEYRQGHLPNTISIPLNELPARTHEIPKDKPIIVVCASGNRSGRGAQILTEAGFENVHNLRGGTMGWMMKGLPLDH